jgi:signal transduction histidine kinase
MLRSLSAVVSLTCLCVLAICLVSAQAISTRMEQVYFVPVFQNMDKLELADARSAFETGGQKQLASYMERLNRAFGGSHYLLDAAGNRLDGEGNLAYLLPPPPQTRSRGLNHGMTVITQRSEDGGFWFVATKPGGMPEVRFEHFYLLLIAGILALGALLSAYIVFPLRKMVKLVEAIGVDNLSARIRSRRKDEIGALARAYDDMAQRLEEAFTRERQLLQDVSHELRAPLTRLNFSLRLARTAQDRELALDEVKRDLDRLSFLVSELTELSIGPPGGLKAHLEFAELDMEAVVSEAVHECEPLAKAKNCRINFSVASRVKVLGNAELLRRAIGNILRNAVRHSPDGSGIEVTLASSAQLISVTVRDWGSGVSPDLLRRIFDPFFQVNSSRAAAEGGLGLGLSIAKRSVEVHGGRIWAENAGPGLRLFVELPVHDAVSASKDGSASGDGDAATVALSSDETRG